MTATMLLALPMPSQRINKGMSAEAGW